MTSIKKEVSLPTRYTPGGRIRHTVLSLPALQVRKPRQPIYISGIWARLRTGPKGAQRPLAIATRSRRLVATHVPCGIWVRPRCGGLRSVLSSTALTYSTLGLVVK
jgi:hypothetical protein